MDVNEAPKSLVPEQQLSKPEPTSWLGSLSRPVPSTRSSSSQKSNGGSHSQASKPSSPISTVSTTERLNTAEAPKVTVRSPPASLSKYVLSVEPPTHPHHLWWWERSAPLLDTMLTESGSYTGEEVASHMRVYRDVVVPCYGPPTPQAKVTPLLTTDGSPFESSWNFTSERSICRYTWEPLAESAGTEANPFGGLELPDLVPILQQASSDCDMRWFTQVMSEWLVRGEAAGAARKAMPPHVERIPQIFLAWDMKGAKRHLKAYFFPVLKSMATGQSTEKLTWDLISRLRPYGPDFAKPVAKLSNYLANVCPFSCPVEMIAIDCIDPIQSRIKIYARSRSVSMATLRNGVTLGGAQTDVLTMNAIAALEKIWPYVIDERGGLAEEQDKEPKEPRTLHKGICFVFEMRANNEHIDVKAHVPWANYFESDMHAAANFTSMLKTLGWDDAARNYSNVVAATARIPGRDYSNAGGISYWSYNFGAVGSYISSYFSPMSQTC